MTQELAPQPQPTIIVHDGHPVTTSLEIAARFNKRHDTVLRAIRNMRCSEGFSLRNFAESSYLNDRKQPHPMYYITKNGFAFLALGFTGAEADRWREAYINAFDRMEAQLKGNCWLAASKLKRALFEDHPKWEGIAACLDMGYPMSLILDFTGYRSPSTIRRAAKQMERHGLLEKRPGWRGRPRWRIPGRAHLPTIPLWGQTPAAA